jgi:hypothetical protein
MIVPTGRLFWIPWMAMPVPQCAGTKPLVEITPVGVVPSLGLAVWLMARAGLPACQDTIAFVGPNYFEDDSERDALRKTLNLNPSNWFPNARPGDLLDRKLEARCLAIACHGHAGREPYLQLFGEEADGRLSLQQLIERRPHLRAELALLGCCWTGQESTGVLDEVSGFAAALMQCGVRHVIAGLGMIPLAIATYPVVLDLVTRGTCAHFRQGILKLRKEYDSISLSHPACWSLIQWYGLPIQATGSAADTRT